MILVILGLLLISTGTSQGDTGDLGSFINKYWNQSR